MGNEHETEQEHAKRRREIIQIHLQMSNLLPPAEF